MKYIILILSILPFTSNADVSCQYLSNVEIKTKNSVKPYQGYILMGYNSAEGADYLRYKNPTEAVLSKYKNTDVLLYSNTFNVNIYEKPYLSFIASNKGKLKTIPSSEIDNVKRLNTKKVTVDCGGSDGPQIILTDISLKDLKNPEVVFYEFKSRRVHYLGYHGWTRERIIDFEKNNKKHNAKNTYNNEKIEYGLYTVVKWYETSE